MQLALSEHQQFAVKGIPMKAFKLLVAGLALVCGQAFAAPYTWTDTVDPVDRLITPLTPYIFNFNITDGLNGYRPGLDSITEYTVTIDLYDDSSDPFWARAEFAIVNLPGIGGDSGFFDLSGEEFGGNSLLGWFELDTFGYLTVAIQSLTGDFYFGSGTLNAEGDVAPDSGNEVPEPGSMLLLGAALTAAALATRRRKH
jgi:hypothetical protein